MSTKPKDEMDLKGLDAPAPAAAAETSKLQTPPELLTPAAQAFANAQMTAAIKELFTQLAPILAQNSLSPEKFASALSEAERLRRAPDPAATARELRERQLMQIEQEENARNRKLVQESCPHVYPSGAPTFHIIRNYPDRQPRFSCPLCSIWVHPREWRIGAPTPEEPRGHAYIENEHPLYRTALKSLASKGQ